MMRIIVLSLLLGVAGLGCQKARPAMGAAEPPGAEEVRGVADQMVALLTGGDTNAAIALLDASLAASKVPGARAWFFNGALSLELASGRETAARERYLAVVGKDENLTRAGFSPMHDYYAALDDPAALAEWAKRMCAANLPNDLAAAAYAWNLTALASSGPIEALIAEIPVGMRRFEPGPTATALDGAFHGLVGAGKLDEAERVLAAVSAAGGTVKEYVRLVACGRVRLALARGQWNEAERTFQSAVESVGDGDVVDLLRLVCTAATGKDAGTIAPRVCQFVLAHPSTQSGARTEAARQILAAAKKAQGAAGVPGSIGAMLKDGLSPELAFRLFDSEFYPMLEDGHRERVAEMVALGEAIGEKLANENDRVTMRTLLMDGYFIVEDYAAALKALDAGVPERSREWHEMARVKLKAHLALKEGRKLEAVALFREFMKRLGGAGEPEYEPVSGLMHTRAMCLGLNARRIGDILVSAGSMEEAKQAYGEARDHYTKALSEFQAGAREYKVIQDALASMPSAQ